MLLSILLLTGCGGNSPVSSDLPPLPPTMTAEPLVTVEPTPTPEGETLDVLDGGQEVIARDRRYSLQMPEFWVRSTAPPDDIAFRESGGIPADDGFTYSVMREPLPQSIQSADDYAEFSQAALQESAENVEMLSLDPVSVGGMQGIRAVYTTVAGTEAVLVHQIYLIDGETGFLLTGNAPLDGDTDAAMELFDRISGSFSFPRG